MTRIIGIDQGTTSTRALLAEDGRARVVHGLPHAQHYPAPGRVEHDADEIVANIHACLEAAGPADAIGIDNQGESCLAWDGVTKEPLSPVIVWQDSRTSDVTERLRADGAEELTLARAGLPLDPYFSAAKLGWLHAHVADAPRLLREGRLRLGTTDAYFLDRLAGTFATDVTTASRTSLMDLATGRWDEELCRLFGVPLESLPPIVPTTGEMGAVVVGGRFVPVTASVVDQQAGLYGHGCRQPGDAKVTFGTGAFVQAVTGGDICRAAGEGLLPTVAWQFSGQAATFAVDGGVYTAGAAVDWARRLGLFADFGEIEDFTGPSAIERGLAFVPALSGLACPHWRREATGVFLGLTLEAGPRDLARAVLEGIALRTAEVVAAMAARIPLGSSISIDGGMSRNAYFCRFLADALGRRVVARGTGEFTALGTALLAGARADTVFAGAAHDRVYEPAAEIGPVHARFARAVEVSLGWER